MNSIQLKLTNKQLRAKKVDKWKRSKGFFSFFVGMRASNLNRDFQEEETQLALDLRDRIQR